MEEEDFRFSFAKTYRALLRGYCSKSDRQENLTRDAKPIEARQAAQWDWTRINIVVEGRNVLSSLKEPELEHLQLDWVGHDFHSSYNFNYVPLMH